MKKSMLFKIFILLAFVPACLQAQTIQLPTVEITVSQDKVPLAVKTAVIKDFGEGHQPMEWVTAGTIFDTDAWSRTVNVDKMEIYHYFLHTQTSTGSTLYATYTPDGKLLQSLEEVRNFEPPRVILANLEKSSFKDWKITEDVHVVKVNEKGKAKEHYDFKVEKGNQMKTLYFDKAGKLVKRFSV